MAEQNPLAWLGNFLAPFAGGGRPVFLGDRKIGSWGDVGTLCGGSIRLEVPADEAGTPDQWTTKDDFWRTVPVLGFCAAAGYHPAWATADEASAAQAVTPGGAAILAGPTHTVMQAPAALSQALSATGDVAKWAAIGGLGVAGFLLILRATEPPRGRRR
jgi:hypothetical protein